jgi:tetratricopeptide (TPR) repeat protein
MVAAGKLCLRYFANDDALSLARRGLTWAEELPVKETVELSIELHEIMMASGPVEDWEAAAEHYVSLAEQALDNGSTAHARIGYYMASFQRWSHGQWSGAWEETLQLERVTRGGDSAEHIFGMAETSKCLAMLERDLSQADAMQMEARALAAREHLSHPAIDAAAGILRYHENKLDEAREYFMNARTLCRTSGDRVSEFQALEYLAMIDIEEGNRETAPGACIALRDLGMRIREGSEAPFARAMCGFCDYVTADDDTELIAALTDLRIADAKHRLAYILNRAAFVDIERGRTDQAIERAAEALACAHLLQRDTEILMAHSALLRGGDITTDHAWAMRELLEKPVAVWARHRAEQALSEAN